MLKDEEKEDLFDRGYRKGLSLFALISEDPLRRRGNHLVRPDELAAARKQAGSETQAVLLALCRTGLMSEDALVAFAEGMMQAMLDIQAKARTD